MAGQGRQASPTSRNRDKLDRGQITNAPGVGWQYGEVPPPPTGLKDPTREAYEVWMGAWFAAFWTPADLPTIRHMVRLYDQVERGQFVRSGELRIMLDTMGVTPKGQQDRRWRPPAEVKPAKKVPKRKAKTYTALKAAS